MKAKELIAVAESEVGYIGKKSNAELDSKTANIVGKFTKYAQDLYEAGYYNFNKNGWDWCCCFVDWCFLMAANGNKEEALKVKPVSIYGAVVKYAYEEFEKIDRTSILPTEGCQVFLFDDSGDGELAHTGIVIKVEEDKIKTIEGNWNNRVVLKEYSIDDKHIAAYGLPMYEAEPEPEPEPDDDSNNDPDWDSLTHFERISSLFSDLAVEFWELAEEEKRNK